MGRGGLWGSRDWGNGRLGRSGDFITGYLIRIKNSRKLLHGCFFCMIQIYFPPQGVVISVMFLHGFDNLFNVPR